VRTPVGFPNNAVGIADTVHAHSDEKNVVACVDGHDGRVQLR